VSVRSTIDEGAGTERARPARHRKAAVEAHLDELRLAVDEGELLDVASFEADVLAALGEFGAVLNRAASSVALAQGLSNVQREALRAWLDGERRALVEALQKRWRDG